MKKTNLFALILVLGFGFFVAAPATAASDKDKEGKAAKDPGIDSHYEVTGTVAGYTPTTLSIEYSSTPNSAYDMLLHLGDKTQFTGGATGVKDLQIGDAVAVNYVQTYRMDEKGQKEILETMATDVKLLRKAPPEPLLSSTEAS